MENKSLLIRLWAVLTLLVICFCSLSAQGKYGGGSGTTEDPYQILDVNHMQAFGADANDWDKCFKLMADVNMIDYIFTKAVIAPDVNDTKPGFQGTAFTGIFDGNDHKIINLKVDTAGADNKYIGLFGLIDTDSEVRNLGMENVSIIGGDGSSLLGGLCGINCGTIINCYATGMANGNRNLGGLCGYNYSGTIINCYATGMANGSQNLGGLCGYNYSGAITNCYAIGSVIGGEASSSLGGLCGKNDVGTIMNCFSGGYVSGENVIGGLCGENDGGTISNCSSTVEVAGGDYLNTWDLGGLCGYNDEGVISDSYASGSVTGRMYLGGLCGRNREATIKNCYAIGDVSGRAQVSGLSGTNTGIIMNSYSTGNVVGDIQSGGLVGLNSKEFVSSIVGTITNSYATGSVTGGVDSDGLGGLVGENYGTISNCYATAIVSGNSSLGGLCGYQSGVDAQMTNSFWDIDTSGMSIGYNLDSSEPGTVINVLDKTTGQMQMQSTFTDYDWDFIDIWNIGENQTYPYLRKYSPANLNKDHKIDLLDIKILCEQWLEKE